ncbi:unnamed protein product [Adineta steineri]|uniref:NHL repeat containing protein n=1 Tax=Adineta steineri TaxID=433720 RepID=A0A814JU12_9BILA|nr:unnamed protein product [Adineta steineri]CAF1178632.1 unnamed protein product [Adineta steineri]
MIEKWNTSLSFSDYYEACAPTYCTYTQIKHATSFTELLVTLISTIGGLVIVLRLITFQFVKIVFSLLRTKTNQRQQVRRKLLDRFNMLLSKLKTFLSIKVLNLNIFPARIFGSKIDRLTVKHLGQWSTRLYLTLLSIIFVILTLYTIIQPQTLTKSCSTPSLNVDKNLMKDYSDELEYPCSMISSPYDEYVQIQPIFHQICSSDLISNEWRLNITANLVSNLSAYNQKDYRLFLSTHLQFLNGLCQLSMQTVHQSIQQSLSSLMITKQLLSEENLNLHIDSMINEAKSNAPSKLIRLLSLLRATNHGNAIVSSYGTNYQYKASVYNTFSTTLYTQAMIYDNNCSCQLNSTCITDASFIKTNSTQPITIKGLKMGCTPSESLLASTLECFYDQSCINLIQTMTGYNKNITPIPLNITNSRFLMNMTVINLINDLFIEKWSTIMNYSSYFNRCSPMICSYTYIQQLNTFYTLIYLLGLYGGLTIILKWISPKIFYFINKIYQRRKKTISPIEPISTIEGAAIEIMDANNINNTTAPSQSKNLFSISPSYWIIDLTVFILVTIGILISFIYVRQERKNHSTSTESPTISTSTTTTSEPKLNKWKQDGITVAGGNGEGQELNQVSYPPQTFIDKKKNIFIVDRDNHRIIEWKYNAKEGQIIAGGNGYGDQIDQLYDPTDVIVDQQDHSIIIADCGNERVIQWMNQNQQILIKNIYCYGLTMDKNGFLYVSDWLKNVVRRWKMGEYNNEGIIVAGGNGKGNQLNQISYPRFIFVDEDQSVYVSDEDYNRVMKWRKDAKEGTIVAGGNGLGGNLNQLASPRGVIVDNLGQIYVADCWNHRIMRWCDGKEEGEIVVGGNGQGNQPNQLYHPFGISFDDERNLYVADLRNHRIQKFEIIL